MRERLTDAGLEAYLPTAKQERRWSDRSKSIEMPVFPGYLFLRATPAELRSAARVSGVCQILGNDLRPEQIPEEQIEDVRRVLSMRAAAPSPYVAGQAVRVKRGPLAGVSGVVKRFQGATTLIVAIELLRRAVALQIESAELESA